MKNNGVKSCLKNTKSLNQNTQIKALIKAVRMVASSVTECILNAEQQSIGELLGNMEGLT